MRKAGPSEAESRTSSFAIITGNPEMLQLLEYARRVAATPYPVLIQGETGTGKELMARGIHAASGRAGVFAPINCGAIPETLFEAELFGAKRGAYTGLDSDRKGLFEIADNGTLFLDEIGEMPPSTQAKLLRVLQDGEIRPLGSSKSHRVQVRIIAATHQDLDKLVERNLFRMDLFFRISTAAIRLPPLRDRPEDIPLLLREAAREAARVQGLPPPEIDDTVIDGARSYPWPGNVRELMHAVATALLNAGDRPLRWSDFNVVLSESGQKSEFHDSILNLPFAKAREKFVRTYLSHLLQKTEGNLSHAAKLAGLPRTTLRDKLRRYGIDSTGTRSVGRPKSRRRGMPPGRPPVKG